MVLQVSCSVINDPQPVDAKLVMVSAFNSGKGTDMFLVEHDSPKDGLDLLTGGV